RAAPARCRRALTWAGRPAPAGQPRVPEVQERRRAEAPAQLLAGGPEEEGVAELDAADVLVEDRLDPVDDPLALLHVALAGELDHQPVLLLVAPRARPVALQRREQGGVEAHRVPGREHVPELGLTVALHQRGPVDDL